MKKEKWFVYLDFDVSDTIPPFGPYSSYNNALKEAVKIVKRRITDIYQDNILKALKKEGFYSDEFMGIRVSKQ